MWYALTVRSVPWLTSNATSCDRHGYFALVSTRFESAEDFWTFPDNLPPPQPKERAQIRGIPSSCKVWYRPRCQVAPSAKQLHQLTVCVNIRGCAHHGTSTFLPVDAANTGICRWEWPLVLVCRCQTRRQAPFSASKQVSFG